ncbi:MAG: hypothetical protein JM58_09450 [Peptococcaceae bacterium BICA1-8]|nr:MAG: hypothetical protein JM58_09450 [Peptococcaceae bacterium BICA1-8]
MEIIIEKEINPAQLMDELLAEGLIQTLKPDGTSTVQGNTVYIENDTNIERINEIILNHVPN